MLRLRLSACCGPAPARRLESTLTHIKPSSKAEREAPTPLVLLSASRLQRPSSAQDTLTGWERWTGFFAERGWTSFVVDLDLDAATKEQADTAGKLLDLLENDIVRLLRSAPGGMPFPPALLSRGWLAGLAAQQYASSHSLSALGLFDPAISSRQAHKDHPDVLRTEPEEPNFEPRFPVRVAWSQAELDRQKQAGIPWYEVHRIEHELEEDADEALDRVVWAHADQDGPADTQQWLEDEVGL